MHASVYVCAHVCACECIAWVWMCARSSSHLQFSPCLSQGLLFTSPEVSAPCLNLTIAALGSQMGALHGHYLDSRNLNSGSHGWEARALSIEPSL